MVDTAFQVAGTFTARQGRQVQGVVMAGATAARPLGALSGVRPGTSPTTVSATSTTVTVGPFAGVIDAQTAAEAGPYEFAFDAATTMALTAQDPSNPRSDIVYARINDTAEDGGGVTSAVRVYQAGVAGVGAPIPVPNVLPVTRALVVAVINVPKAGTGSPTVTWVAPYTVAAGGILPVPAGVYPAVPFVGQYVDDAALGLLRWNGSTWISAGGGLVPIVPGSVAGSGVSLGAGGKVTFAAATAISVNNVFSAQFDHYEILFDVPTIATAANLLLRLRAGGTDLATSSYVYGGSSNNTTTTPVASNGVFTGFYLTRDPVGATNASGTVELFSPAGTGTKRTLSKAVTGNATYVTADTVGGSQSSTTAYDGFTIVNDSGSAMTGTLTIRGWSKG